MALPVILRFELAGALALLAGAFPGVLVKAADQLVDVFCQRAMVLHNGR
jgi:formate-dependent nitrite reductase membrane component NrfD